jgi:hypothetical protein
MMTNTHEVLRLGDLVVAVFDAAAHYSSDPKEVSRLATLTVMHMLRASCAKDIGSTARIEFIEDGTAERGTSLGRRTMKPCLAPSPPGD